MTLDASTCGKRRHSRRWFTIRQSFYFICRTCSRLLIARGLTTVEIRRSRILGNCFFSSTSFELLRMISLTNVRLSTSSVSWLELFLLWAFWDMELDRLHMMGDGKEKIGSSSTLRWWS